MLLLRIAANFFNKRKPDCIVEKVTMVANSDKIFLWKLYNDSFKRPNEQSPCRQSFHEDDFFKLLSALNVYKFIVKIDGQVIGLALVTNELKNAPWISEDYFKVNFSQQYKENNVYYFMGLVIDANFRRKGLSTKILNDIFKHLPSNCIVGFDHSLKINKHIGKFPYLLSIQKKVKVRYLDSMRYYAVTIN